MNPDRCFQQDRDLRYVEATPPCAPGGILRLPTPFSFMPTKKTLARARVGIQNAAAAARALKKLEGRRGE